MTVPPVRFVILAAPRSGSNMLCTLLNSHPAVVCHHELYNPAGAFYALDYRNTGFAIAERASRDARPLDFLMAVWRAHPDAACVGFKMTHRQQPEVFYTLLDDPGVRKIVLTRRNAVRRHVSRLIAERRDLWEHYTDSSLDTVQVHVDPQALEQDIAFDAAYYAEIRQRLDASGQQACAVDYESLNAPRTHERLLAYLELPAAPLRVASTRQNPQGLNRLIENFDQVVSHYAGHDEIRIALTSEA